VPQLTKASCSNSTITNNQIHFKSHFKNQKLHNNKSYLLRLSLKQTPIASRVPFPTLLTVGAGLSFFLSGPFC
jgi:hypothetical protein